MKAVTLKGIYLKNLVTSRKKLVLFTPPKLIAKKQGTTIRLISGSVVAVTNTF